MARDAPWRAVVAAHPLESHDPAEWLRYGLALSQLVRPAIDQRQQQQQVGLAFAHALAVGASKEAVARAQRQATLLALVEALELAGAGAAAAALGRGAMVLQMPQDDKASSDCH